MSGIAAVLLEWNSMELNVRALRLLQQMAQKLLANARALIKLTTMCITNVFAKLLGQCWTPLETASALHPRQPTLELPVTVKSGRI